MKQKQAKAVTIIGGADGPTSVFLAGRTDSKTLKNRVRQLLYQRRRRRAEKRIAANPHTVQEVAAYAAAHYHAAEIPKTQKTYLRQYASAKESLIFMYKPELLSGFDEITAPDVFDEESAKELYRQLQLRSETAAKVPESEMPMDFHLYEISVGNGHLEMAVDFVWDTILGMSSSGDRCTMKKLKKISDDLYLYYGVSEQDIQDKTQRYSSLVTMLSGR
ncbi:MAG: sodium ion-translocating decarboxylase subunit beta [Lachnospiraceae bacterium]|nr:sodium ion-translocating decarboxylase subunit beta [Lachnospiraceae bacterium]